MGYPGPGVTETAFALVVQRGGVLVNDRQWVCEGESFVEVKLLSGNGVECLCRKPVFLLNLSELLEGLKNINFYDFMWYVLEILKTTSVFNILSIL